MESLQGRLSSRRKLFVAFDLAGAASARRITCTNRSSRCHDASSFQALSKLSLCVSATPAKAYQFPRPRGAVSHRTATISRKLLLLELLRRP
jgi:hypothetical protein